MATLTVSVPDEMKAFVEAQAAREGFGSVSEYVQTLLSQARARHDRRAHVDRLLLEGLDSGPATPMTASDWDAIRDEVRRRHPERRGRADGPQGAASR